MTKNGKIISVVIPTYNEEENVVPMTQTVRDIFEKQLPEYDFEIIYIDNHSRDGTRKLLRKLCAEDRRVKAIFRQLRSPVHGLRQAYGDAVIRLNADFQDPPELIPQFVREWEKGSRIVIGIKNKSEDSRIMGFLRRKYYALLRKITDIGHIENFTGVGLYDKAFVDVVRGIHDPMPYLRGMIAELGYDYATVLYDRPKRRAGKSKNNFYSLYDVAMTGITAYSKVPLRVATFGGFILGALSFLIALIYFVLKLVHWDWFRSGITPLVIGVFFIGGVQLFFTGLMGEYILAINQRVLDRPLVVEEERINFDDNTPVID